jgi:hypothetical protein
MAYLKEICLKKLKNVTRTGEKPVTVLTEAVPVTRSFIR